MLAVGEVVARLRRLADGAERAEDRAWLADRLDHYLAGAAEGVSLDAAFGLAPGSGSAAWWRVEALAARDAALRALAARHYAGLSTSRQAKAIHGALSAYAATGWRFDRLGELPGRHVGTEREMLFDALKARDAVPSVPHIRRVLSGWSACA